MDQQLITHIITLYGIQGRFVGEPQKGYRNSTHLVVAGNKRFNLIMYKNEPEILARIKNANRVGEAAHKAGLPARALADPRIISIGSGTRTRYAALYNYLPGKTIAWEAYTMEHLKQLGETMATFHERIKSYNVANLPEVTLESAALNTRMLRYFHNNDVRKALAQKCKVVVVQFDFAKLLQFCNYLPDKQALHMDFVRGNVLFEDKRITGIIDFEKVAVGSPLFDIARTLAFLLVDCKYKPENKIRKYFLRSGYRKRGKQRLTDYTINGVSVLEQLVNFFLLHDFYKFLRHNPYESLAQNEHFARTKALLLKRGLIAKV